mmetsp:Transcript_16853/g.16102  ORF Transcript_16853/g.16102 Transcript_16853/m.16102 type:complete len:319 (-) Transcript_16853:371-1327(-)
MRLENFPESEGFIGGGAGNGRSVRAECEVEDSVGVAPQLGDLLHVGVLPDAQLVVDEAVRGEDLLIVGVPLQRAHLRVRLDRVHQLSRLRIPELYALVSRAPSRSQQVLLPGTPGNGLHGSLVVSELELGAVGVGAHVVLLEQLRGVPDAVVDVPDAEHVVVAPTRQLLPVGAPLEAAHLLAVGSEGTDEARVAAASSDVVVEDLGVEGAAAEDGCLERVPGEGADSALVLVVDHLDALELDCVPELDLLAGGADGEDVRTGPLHPGDRSHQVQIVLRVKELLDLPRGCVPQIHRLGQAHRHHIVRTPLQQIQIVIVN